MMTYADDFSDVSTEQSLRADAELFSAQTITLSMDHLDRARTLSQAVRPPEQWQAYQNAIALFGVQQWLAERGIDISSTIEQCSVYGGAIAGLLNGVCSLPVNDFNLCLLPMGSLTDEWISVPRASLELSHYVPHCFVGVDVREELNQVTVWGSLRFDTLQTHLQTTGIETDANWTYRIPQQWFNPDPNALLLSLRCLESSAIAPTVVIPPPSFNRPVIDANIPVLRPRLQSSPRPLWKLLNWNQVAPLLAESTLADSLLGTANEESTNRAMNLGQWLQGQLDGLAQSLNWTLLPPVVGAMRGTGSRSPMRSSVEQFEDVINTLERQGVAIPAQARGGYLDIPFGTEQVRLYVVTWDSAALSLDRPGLASPALGGFERESPSPENETPQWSLLTVLGPSPEQPLPNLMSLQIRDEHEVLDSQTLALSTVDTYLYSQVQGDINELFWVTIDVDHQESLTLPPFTFQSGDATDINE